MQFTIAAASAVFTGALCCQLTGQCPTGPVRLEGSGIEQWDQSGFAVAIDGDVAVVGAPSSDVSSPGGGAVYVFRRSAAGWHEEAMLVPPVPTEYIVFGSDVDISGDVIVVGTLHHDRAYVHRRDPLTGTWPLEAVLVNGDIQPGDRFGSAVSVSGDRIVVGAPYHDPDDAGEFGDGAVYVFRNSGAGQWIEEAKLTHECCWAMNYGIDVAIDGTTIIAGMPGNRMVFLWPEGGFALVHRLVGSIWSNEARLSPPVTNSLYTPYFGYSVDIEDDIAVVGAPLYGPEYPWPYCGAAFVFRCGKSWMLETELMPRDHDAGGTFGGSVAIHNGRIVVGRDFDPILMDPKHATVAVFDRLNDSWEQIAEFKPPVTGNSLFGYRVALSGSEVLIGMPNAQGVPDTGPLCGAWVYTTAPTFADCDADGWEDICQPDCNDSRVPDLCDIEAGTSADINRNWMSDECESLSPVISEDANFVSDDPARLHRFGGAVSISGDVMVIGGGRRNYSIMSQNQDTVYVYRRVNGNWDPEAILHAPQGVPGGMFGCSVAVDGDVIAVGAPHHNLPGGSNGEGVVHIFRRVGLAWVHEGQFQATSPVERDYFGSEVAISGNLVAITNGHWQTRRVRILKYSVEQGWLGSGTFTPPECGGSFGNSIALDGELVVVGSPRYCGSSPNYGRAYVYRRVNGFWTLEQTLGPSGVVTSGSWTPDFGAAVAVDGSWIAVGMPSEFGTYGAQGYVYVFHREGTTWILHSKLRASDPWRNDAFGAALAIDGSQLLVGVPNDEDHGMNSGSAYWFRLNEQGQWTEHRKLLASNGGSMDQFGLDLAISGSSAVIGAYLRSGREYGEGAAYAFDHLTQEMVCDIAPPGGDGLVNVQDLLAVIAAWGACPSTCPPSCTADIAPAGGDCTINVQDLLFVVANWG